MIMAAEGIEAEEPEGAGLAEAGDGAVDDCKLASIDHTCSNSSVLGAFLDSIQKERAALLMDTTEYPMCPSA